MSILLPRRAAEPPYPFPIYARTGWLIPLPTEHEINQIQATSRVMSIHAQEMLKWRRNLVIRSESIYPYNCVGMIFASRRAWIDIDHIYDVLREDGYEQVAIDQVIEGDVVLYKRGGLPTHIGLIITIDRSLGTPNIRVMSKWGADPEFIHFIEDVPEIFGRPSEFYTDRRTP